MIPFKIDITSTTFCDTTIITYENELPPSGKKLGFNLMGDADFTISYITGKTPNSPAGHQLPTQAFKNVLIIAINEEEPITAQGTLDELNIHQKSL